MSASIVCAFPHCVALAEPGGALCTIHQNVTVRTVGDVPIHCYACDGLIRTGRKWAVRTEGAFHLRPACYHASPEKWKIQSRSAA